MSLSTEIIDIPFTDPQSHGEPMVPFSLKGEHLRFIGWPREYTFTVDSETITVEGPFQDDNPNANEFYQVSRGVASRWIEVKHGKIRLRIPGRGRWGIDIRDNPNFELQTARLITWMSQIRGKAALDLVEEHLREQMFYWPSWYSFLQCVFYGLVAVFFALFASQGKIAIAAHLGFGAVFFLVFYFVAIRQSRAGLFLGLFLNLFLLALPLLETYTIGERYESLGLIYPFFFPFCLSPIALLIPLSMSAYLYALMDHPRQRRFINRRDGDAEP